MSNHIGEFIFGWLIRLQGKEMIRTEAGLKYLLLAWLHLSLADK